jgi:hypothetical protein
MERLIFSNVFPLYFIRLSKSINVSMEKGPVPLQKVP